MDRWRAIMVFNNIDEAITTISDLSANNNNTDIENKSYISLGALCKSYLILKNSGLHLDIATVDTFIDACNKIGNASLRGALGFIASRRSSGTLSANVKELIKLFKKEKTELELKPEDQIIHENTKMGSARVGPLVIAVITSLENNDLDKSAILKNLANNLSPADSVVAFDKYVEYLKHKVDERREQIAEKYPTTVSIDKLIEPNTKILDEAKNRCQQIGYLTKKGVKNKDFKPMLGDMLLRSLPYQEHNLEYAENLKKDGVVITEQRDAIAENFITIYKKNGSNIEFDTDYNEISTDSNILTQVFNISQQLKYGDTDQNDSLDMRLDVLRDFSNDSCKYKNIIDQILFFAPMVRDNAQIKFDLYDNMSKI